MKAIYLTNYNDPDKAFEIKEIEKPIPKEYEVLIKVQYSGLNFADVIARRGMYPDAPKNPALLGYDVAGEIEAVGPNVTDFVKGQKVVAMTRFGGYAEYVATSIYGVSALSDDADLAEATILATQACTAYYCAEVVTTLHKGEKVLIQAAAGGVGSLLVRMAKNRGCIVYGTASSGKHDYLKEIGVDYVIDYQSNDFYEILSQGNVKLDVVFDSLGGMAFKKAMKLLAPGGRMVNFGAAEQLYAKSNKLKLVPMLWGFGLFSPISLLMQSKSIITVNMLRIADFKPLLLHTILQQVVKQAKDGTITLHLDRVFHYSEISNAHSYLESRKSKGKVVIKWY
jgi:NADPH2:quinone reductase